MDIDVASGKISGTVTLEKPASTYPVWVVSVAGFTVISSDEGSEMAQALAGVLAEQGEPVPNAVKSTLWEAVQTKDDVLILHISPVTHQGFLRPLPEAATTKEILDALKQKKVIGVGHEAPRYFEKLGLAIGSEACMSSRGDMPIEIRVEQNSTIGKPWPGQRMVATAGSADFKDVYFNAELYLPRNDPRCAAVDVIARAVGNENYAPVVRQGNYIMTGVEVPPVAWTADYRRFFRDLALAMQARPLEPFAVAKREITKSGTYKFDLAKGFSTDEIFDKTFYFKFTKPTRFSAQLEHAGSNSVMLMFNGGRFQIRKDAQSPSGQPLEISFDITQDDIQDMGDRCPELNVTNFDRNNAAHCELTIKYEE
jgi:hypothetical protein